MGRVVTPKYRVEVLRVSGCSHLTDMAYDGARFGRANLAGLVAFVDVINLSFSPGGVNYGSKPIVIQAARLVRQFDGAVVAEASF